MFRTELQRNPAIIFVRIHFVTAPLLFRLHATNIFGKFEETENKMKEHQEHLYEEVAPEWNKPGIKRDRGKGLTQRSDKRGAYRATGNPRTATGSKTFAPIS
jgi:hypothetical protein